MTDMQNLPKQTAELDKGSCAVWRGFTINTQEFADKEYYIFFITQLPRKGTNRYFIWGR